MQFGIVLVFLNVWHRCLFAETKVAQMGVRSRCKDAMAVLERIPNPQSIRLPKFRVLECEPSCIRHQVSPLRFHFECFTSILGWYH